MTRRRRRRISPAVWRALLLVREATRLPDDQWGHVCAAVRSRDGNRCQLRRWWGWGPKCGREAECVDHIRPVALGGASDLYNCRAACFDCNLRKWAHPPIGWAIPRFVRVWGSAVGIAYAASHLPRASAGAGAPTWYAAVVSEAQAATLAPGMPGVYASRDEAERAAATWNAMGGSAQWYVEEIER